ILHVIRQVQCRFIRIGEPQEIKYWCSEIDKVLHPLKLFESASVFGCWFALAKISQSQVVCELNMESKRYA
ncbi:hypothetical protein C5167_041853, partial [Papaver somniferum]